MYFPNATNNRVLPAPAAHADDPSVIHTAPLYGGGSSTYFQAPPPRAAAGAHLKVFWAHKGAFVLSAVVCVGLAALITFAMTPIYRARGSLELQTPPGSGYQMREADASAINGPTFDAYLDTQIGILHSETIIRRVMDKLHLVERMNARKPQGLSGWIAGALPFGKEPYTRETAFESAQKHLTVRQSRLDNLVEILYDDPDPVLAAEFVNAVASEYSQENLEARWRMAQNTGNWLASHLDDMRVKLERSEKALQEYSQKNGLLFAIV
jgi:polysaccharide biosynthesis transport protein